MKFEEGCGFETTDCLECLQILDILIYGRRVCFRIWSSREENVLHTSVNQLLYSCRQQSSAYIFPHYCLFCTPYMFYLSIMLFLIPTKKNLSEWRIYETPPRHLHTQFSNLFLIIFLLQNVSFFTVLFSYLLKKRRKHMIFAYTSSVF